MSHILELSILQSCRSSWMMHSESIHRYRIFRLRVSETASRKVVGRSAIAKPHNLLNMVPRCVVKHLFPPQQWLSATYGRRSSGFRLAVRTSRSGGWLTSSKRVGYEVEDCAEMSLQWVHSVSHFSIHCFIFFSAVGPLGSGRTTLEYGCSVNCGAAPVSYIKAHIT